MMKVNRDWSCPTPKHQKSPLTYHKSGPNFFVRYCRFSFVFYRRNNTLYWNFIFKWTVPLNLYDQEMFLFFHSVKSSYLCLYNIITFFLLRWKGENVSTNEVLDILTMVTCIEQANVYGVTVPGLFLHYSFKASSHTVSESVFSFIYATDTIHLIYRTWGKDRNGCHQT